jgi:hypothetical protein
MTRVLGGAPNAVTVFLILVSAFSVTHVDAAWTRALP